MIDTPTPAALRAELERLVVTDLLGPSDPHEQLPGVRSPVREWYLVGMLAPLGTIIDPSRGDGDDLPGDSDDGAPGPDDRPAKTVLFPSSAGFTAAADLSCTSLKVTASWGRYEKIDNPDPAATGAHERLWQRVPSGGSVVVELVEGDVGLVVPDPAQPDVVIEGRCRRTPSCWLVTLFLVNKQLPVKSNIDERWLFQIELAAESTDGAAVFVGRDLALHDRPGDADAELRHLDLLYREKVEFAVGHGIAVHAEPSPADPHRAVAVRTSVIPRSEVAKIEAPGPADPALDAAERALLGAVTFDMEALSKLDGPAASATLAPLADAYDRWLDRQADRIGGLANDQADTAREALDAARAVARRLRAGIELLTTDPIAAEAFAFANHAMWQQRVHTLVAAARRDDPKLNLPQAEALVATEPNWSWRPFQLAFILVNLPSLADPTHAERQLDTGTADLLFFPAGGGKTEAYLGLTAFTLAVRRLQGDVGGHSGEGGVGVLMRYTLRLLTAQQFQRAATLICACEVRRRELVAAGDQRWGETPFRIGMWVGGAVSANWTEDAARDLEDLRNTGWAKGAGSSLVACPWCGEPLDPARDTESPPQLWRTLVSCGDSKGRCPFTARRSAGEGIPVVTVDEEIYRLLPDLVIATADKFAQLPWRGAASALFGRVTRRCSRHGFRTADLDTAGTHKEADSHPKVGDLPVASTSDCLPRRPPDLIIQDELHLIAGPLGSLFGLYETAIDEIAAWEVDGKPARPKIVASTATIRRAEHQAYNLFCRRLAVFPPQVIDAGDSFFAVERPLDETPGRLYLGVCAMGQRFKAVETRVYTTVLAAAQVLYEKYGAAADPWMTTVGYFNALRELGGMRRMLDDEVVNRLRRTERRRLANRYLYETTELTSRISSSDIPAILDQLGVRFTGEKPAKGERYPVDVVLATNMISVGVDVPRLGLMICAGQPKTTAEYIQATSRVGRDARGPGLVITLYNWARPRDLSHYETFEHYHQTYYRQVEALSVTPFARRALDRGLTALMVSGARHTRADWNPNPAAQLVPVNQGDFDPIVEALRRRAQLVAKQAAAHEVDQLVAARRDKWSKQQKAPGVTLTYARGRGEAIDLLQAPEAGPWTEFTVPNSLREVEVGANLLLRDDDPSDDPSADYPDPPVIEEQPEEAPQAAEDADPVDDADVILEEDAR